MIVAAEHRHQSGCGDESLHEWHVLAAIRTGAIIGTVLTPALSLLGKDVIVVDALRMLVDISEPTTRPTRLIVLLDTGLRL